MTFCLGDRVIVTTAFGPQEGIVWGVTGFPNEGKLYDVRVDRKTLAYLPENRLLTMPPDAIREAA
jgi:hypothetical protein